MQISLFSKVLADRPLHEAIRRAAEMGFDGVEIMARSPHFPVETPVSEARRLREQLDEYGLSVPCLATYTGGYGDASRAESEDELARLEGFLELSVALDCDLVRHGPNGPQPHEATADDFERAAGWMRRAADLAAEYGRTLAVEIHAGKLTETAESTLRLLELIDRENVGAIHDAGNMFITDDDYGPASVERLGEQLEHVHVKDERRVDDERLPGAFTVDTQRGPRAFQPRLLGDGAVDHEPLVRALEEAGYEGHLTAECHVAQGEGDDVRIAEHELAALRRLTGTH